MPAKGNLSMPWCVANRLSMILLCTLPCKNCHKNGMHCDMESEYEIILMYWTKKKNLLENFWDIDFLKLVLTYPTLLCDISKLTQKTYNLTVKDVKRCQTTKDYFEMVRKNIYVSCNYEMTNTGFPVGVINLKYSVC